jgi:hypothetical membrane protein
MLALCGMIAPILFVIIILVAGLLRPGYSQIAQTMSELGQVGTPNALLQDANFAIFGLLVFLFAVGLHRGINQGRGSKLAPAALLVAAVTIFLQGTAFPLPLTYQSNPIGAIGHSAAGITEFIALIFAILVFSRRLKRESQWQGYAFYSLATGVVLIVLFLFVNSQSISGPWFGLFQRLLFVPYLLWVEVIAIRLYALSHRPNPERMT